MEKRRIEQGVGQTRGLDGRALGHKRLYCAQCASNTDIGKLLALSSVSGRKVAASQNVSSLIPKSIVGSNSAESLIGNIRKSRSGNGQG